MVLAFMDTRSINKFVMFLAVCRHCTGAEFEEAIAHLPAFAKTFGLFNGVVQKTRRRVQHILALNPEGITENKVLVREKLAKKVSRLSSSLVTWAEEHGNMELARKAHVTKSMIIAGRDLEAADRIDLVYTLGVAHLDQLGDYGVNKVRLKTIDELSQAFSELIGRPRAVIDARKRATRSLPTLMADADKHLLKLDRLADVLDEDYPEFAEGFRTSRKIINVSASRALSEAEKASAESRAARKALAQARTDAALAEIRKETEATHAQARSIAPPVSGTSAKRESSPGTSPVTNGQGLDEGLEA